MARPANRKVRINDLAEFDDWMHVLSDPVVVKIYAGSSHEERMQFKNDMISILQSRYGMVVTANADTFTLSKNQVNIPISAMSNVLHHLGARICRVGFFGMKWNIPTAEPIIDQFLQRYRVSMTAQVPWGKNIFDYGIQFEFDQLHLYKFDRAQLRARRYTKGDIHEMCNMEGYGALEFKPQINEQVEKIKVYHTLCHHILSVIQKQTLDDMPTTTRTMRIRVKQLQDLLIMWEKVVRGTQLRSLLGMRIETTVRAETVVEGRELVSRLDLLRFKGLQTALEGTFGIHTITWSDFLSQCRLKIIHFSHVVHGTNAYAPSMKIRSALTFARQAIGWSGKHMERHLQEARGWQEAMQRQQAIKEETQNLYKDCQHDSLHLQPLILEFLHKARWFVHHRILDKTIPGLMLKKHNRRYWKKDNVYVDHIGPTRYFITKFGANWRTHVQFIE